MRRRPRPKSAPSQPWGAPRPAVGLPRLFTDPLRVPPDPVCAAADTGVQIQSGRGEGTPDAQPQPGPTGWRMSGANPQVAVESSHTAGTERNRSLPPSLTSDQHHFAVKIQVIHR